MQKMETPDLQWSIPFWSFSFHTKQSLLVQKEWEELKEENPLPFYKSSVPC